MILTPTVHWSVMRRNGARDRSAIGSLERRARLRTTKGQCSRCDWSSGMNVSPRRMTSECLKDKCNYKIVISDSRSQHYICIVISSGDFYFCNAGTGLSMCIEIHHSYWCCGCDWSVFGAWQRRRDTWQLKISAASVSAEKGCSGLSGWSALAP